MAKDLNNALTEVEVTYEQIKQIAESMVGEYFTSANTMVKVLENRVESLTIEELRNYLLKLQLEAYSLSELRDRTLTKASCAEAVRKEKYATMYIGQEGGTAAQKDANTTLAISENIVAECLYDLVASLCKTKVDELQRLVAVLTTILMGRMQENKIANMNIAN